MYLGCVQYTVKLTFRKPFIDIGMIYSRAFSLEWLLIFLESL